MTSPAPLADALLTRRPRETSGAATANRFSYQRTWALCHLLKKHETAGDYVLIMEFHDDIIVLDSAQAPKVVDFFQLKTRGEGVWKKKMLVDVPKAPTNARKNPAKRARSGLAESGVAVASTAPRSILGKLLDHSVRFGAHVGTMNLVSNAKFDLPVRHLPASREREKIRLSELTVEAVADMREKLRAELGVQDEFSFDKVYLITSGISLTEHAKHGAGELAAFLDRRRPGGLYAVQPLYRALCDELARRATHEWQPTSFFDLCRRKGIGRAELEGFLLTVDATFDPQRELAAVKEQLGREGVPYRDQVAIERGWRRYQIESMDESNVTVQGLTSNLRSAIADVRSGTAWNSLLELVHAVVHVLGATKESGFSPSYLEGAVLFELKTAEARELQAIGSQPEARAQ